MISISSLLLYGLLLLVLHFIYKFVIKTYILLKFYERQGLKTYYYPVLGYIKQMVDGLKNHDDGHYFMKQFIKNHPDEDGYAYNFGSTVMLFLGTPELNKELTSKHWNLFRELELQPLRLCGCTKGITQIHQDAWKKHRTAVSTVFRYDMLKDRLNHIYTTCDEIYDTMPTGKYIEFTKYAIDITGVVMGKIFFGDKINRHLIDGIPFCQFLLKFLNFAGDLVYDPMRMLCGKWIVEWGLTKKFREFNEQGRKFRQKVRDIINERRALNVKQPNDLIDFLLESQKDADPEKRYDEDEMIDDIMSFSNAASENTAIMTSLTLYMICLNPQFYERLVEENKKCYRKGMTMEEVLKIEFLNAFIKETFRMHSTAIGNVPRYPKEDMKIGKYDVKAQTRIWDLFYFATQKEKYFPNPEKFDPERWLRPETKNLDPYAFTPFSAGGRNCIGRHLAEAEIVILVSEVLKKFKFELDPTYRMIKVSRFLYQPKDHIRLRLTPL